MIVPKMTRNYAELITIFQVCYLRLEKKRENELISGFQVRNEVYQKALSILLRKERLTGEKE